MKDCINKLLLTLALLLTAGTAAVAQTLFVITDGNGNFLSNSSGSIANATSFNPNTCLWTCSGTASGTLANSGYYLYYNNKKLYLNQSTSTSWTISNNQISYKSGSRTYYITCSSKSWSVNTSTSSAANGYSVANSSSQAQSSLTVEYNADVESQFQRVGDIRDYYVSAVSYTPAYNSYSWTDGSGNSHQYYTSTDNSYVSETAPTAVTEAASYAWTSSHPSNVTVTQSTEYPEQATAEYAAKFSAQTDFTVTATATISKNKSEFMTADATVSGSSSATLLSREIADVQVSFDESELYIGETVQINVTTEHDGAVTFSSPNTALAEVSGTGLVTAKGTGGKNAEQVLITVSVAQTDQYEAMTLKIPFTVKKRPVTLTLAYDKSSLTYGDQVPKLTACTLTDGVDDKEVTGTVVFGSSYTGINPNATTGAIVVTKAGEATITAEYQGDDTYMAAKATFDIKVDKASTTLAFDETSYIAQTQHPDNFSSPQATLTPAGAGSVTYSYVSETAGLITLDPAAGTVTLGTLTGTATVTAEFAGNDCYLPSSASYQLVVTSKEIPEVEVNTDMETEMDFYVDDTYNVLATTNATKGLAYDSDNEDVFTIDAEGHLTAVGEGTATLTIASLEDDTYMEYTAEFYITVKKYPVKLVFTYPQTTYYTDYEYSITPNVSVYETQTEMPVGSEGLLSYTATPSTVLTVDEATGQVTMVGGGTGEVTVTFAGTRKYASATATLTLEIRKVPVPGTFIRLKDSAGNYLTSDGTNVTTAADGGASAILWYGTDRSLLFYQCGLYLSNATPQLAAPVNVGESGTKFTVTHEGDNYRISDGTNFLTSGTSNLWTMEEVEYLPLTFKSAGNGFSTFCCPVDVTCPAGVVAYYAAERNAGGEDDADYIITLQSVVGGFIPHGTPVVLQTSYISTYDFYIIDELATSVTGRWEGLVGTYPKVNTASAYNGTQYPYTLQPNKSASAGFYPWKSDTHAAIEPFRCYIPGANAANANGFRFAIDGQVIEGIHGIGIDEQTPAAPVYNLQGVQVGTDLRSLPHGVYIQGGRKVFR